MEGGLQNLNNLNNLNANPFLTPRGSARQFFPSPSGSKRKLLNPFLTPTVIIFSSSFYHLFLSCFLPSFYHLCSQSSSVVIIFSSSFYHLFLSSFLPSLFTVIICRYHLFCHLYHPPFLSLSSFLSSLSSSIPLLIIFFVIFVILHSSPYHLFCHLYHPPFLSLSSLLSSLSSSIPLLIIFLVVLTILQPSSYHFLSSCSSSNPFLIICLIVCFVVGHLRGRRKLPSPCQNYGSLLVFSNDLSRSFIFFIVI